MSLQSISVAFLISCASATVFAQPGPHSAAVARGAEPEFIRVAPDGWHFETATTNRPFIPFGANYYDPATYHAEPYPAYDVTGKFDSTRTDRHFGQLADLGANVVRIFLSAVSFEPQLHQLNEDSFETLDMIVALAKRHDLYVIFDLVDTWEGEPAWQSWEYLADEQTLEGFEFLLRAFGERYADEPTVFAWDLVNEPEVRGPDSGIMGDLFGPWVRLKYGTEDSLQAAWDDYPASGESWGHILPPPYEIFTEQEAQGSTRFFDFQLFREDIGYNWVRRLTDALRSTDPNHMITVGLDQHSVPFKPDGTFYKPYTAFNPQKIVPLVDYVSVHGYDWWDGNVDVFIEGLLRYSYVDKPVVLEEFNLSELGDSIDAIRRSSSGWLHWGAYESELEWSDVLFDQNEQVTALGTAFKSIAGSLTGVSTRPASAQDVALDLKDVLISRSAQDVAYDAYIQAAHSTSDPVGFDVLDYRAPSLMRVTSPAAGEVVGIGHNVQVAWDVVDWNILYETTVDIELSRDGGASWETIVSGAANTGSYDWMVAGPPSESSRIAVIDHRDGTVSGTQDFRIISTVAVEPSGQEAPSTFALGQNYPNPFNPSTAIEIDVPQAAFLTLEIYDVLGREVSTLVSGEFLPGRYRYTWDAARLPSGVYVYRLEAEGFSATRTMLLQK